VLGPLAVRGSRGWTTPPARLRRRALAALALEVGECVDVERLVDALWGERVPPTARKIVQNHVLALRHTMGAGTIETRPGGYVLAISPEEVDACVFEALAVAGRQEWHAGGAMAVENFDQALGLWAGDPYLDLADWSPAQGAIARLVDLRRTMVEDRLDARLGQGEHLSAVAEIEASIADEPLRERRWELLMTALYRSGRQAEALRAFQRARDLLITQLGIEPSPGLRRLEAAMLVQDPAIEWRDDVRPPEGTSPPTRADAALADALTEGEEALRAGDAADAVACFRRALTHVGGAGGSLADECEVLVRLAETEYLVGDPTHRSTGVAAARLADHLGDAELLVRAALAGIRQIEGAGWGVDLERLTMLRRATEVATRTSDRARLLSAQATELNTSPDHRQRRRLSDQALALARASGDRNALHRVLAARPGSIRAPDTLAERLSNAREDLALAEGLDLRSQWGAWSNRAMASMEAGDDDDAEQALRAVAEIAGNLGLVAVRWHVAFVHARQLLWHGDLSAAKGQARRARDLGVEASEPLATPIYFAQLYLIRWDEGRLPELADFFASAPLEQPFDRALACHAYAHLGHTREAQRLLTGLAARGFVDVHYDGFWLTLMSLVADAAARVAVPEIAAEVLELLRPWRDQIVLTPATCLGSVAHYIGVLAAALDQAEEAHDAFAQAARTHERMRAPLWAARTRLEWAQVTGRAGLPGPRRRARSTPAS
jgi:DNA-binding SARP family transcriptional activator